jgi:hypothetical protein
MYTWRKRFAGFQANDIRRLKQLEAENARLKELATEVMKEVAGKKCIVRPRPCKVRGRVGRCLC